MYMIGHWRNLIQAAPDAQAVARVMADYVASIPPVVIDALPAESRYSLLNPDIQAAAISLLHAEMGYRGEREIAELLHDIAQMFAFASTRIARLSGEPLTPAT